MMHDYKFMQNILYYKNMTNNVRYIYLLIQKASRGDGVGLHVQSYNAWESGKMWPKQLKSKLICAWLVEISLA